MGKILGLVIILIIVGVLIWGFAFGGFTKDGGNSESTASTLDGSTESEPTVFDATEASISTEEPMVGETENTNATQEIVNISIVEGDYFYNNERVELDEFKKLLNEMDKNIIVKINDDNATQKAYRDLLAVLDTASISYTE